MKKVVIILGVVFTIGLLSSCTDNSLDDIEKNRTVYNVDKTKIVRPGEQGGN
ncbi:hypothetical protein ACQY1Q_16095 [Tenacibaculum sp. TC6]|uniref:hypothetical protein n=1 Tax=Tenacibaculum sp. TC6 TaxID=3423223 RepID=UPI003D359E14